MIRACLDFLNVFKFLLERGSVSYFFYCLSWCLVNLWYHTWYSFKKYCRTWSSREQFPTVTCSRVTWEEIKIQSPRLGEAQWGAGPLLDSDTHSSLRTTGLSNLIDSSGSYNKHWAEKTTVVKKLQSNQFRCFLGGGHTSGLEKFPG